MQDAVRYQLGNPHKVVNLTVVNLQQGTFLRRTRLFGGGDPVARVAPDGFAWRMGKASSAVNAVSGFLHDLAHLLRQLVQVVGWLILLASSVRLLCQPHTSPPELFVPGVGSMAVLQSLIKPRHRSEIMGTVNSSEDEPAIKTDPSS